MAAPRPGLLGSKDRIASRIGGKGGNRRALLLQPTVNSRLEAGLPTLVRCTVIKGTDNWRTKVGWPCNVLRELSEMPLSCLYSFVPCFLLCAHRRWRSYPPTSSVSAATIPFLWLSLCGGRDFVHLDACGQCRRRDPRRLDDAWDSGTSTWPEVMGGDRTGSLGSHYNAIRLEKFTRTN